MKKGLYFALPACAVCLMSGQTSGKDELTAKLAVVISRQESLAQTADIVSEGDLLFAGRFDARPDKALCAFARPLSAARAEGQDAVSCRQAIIASLRDPDPKVRGAACWVAQQCFDLELIPYIAELLDDDAPSLALPGPISQQIATSRGTEGLPKPVMIRPSVGWMAQQALISSTMVLFPSRRDFERWWSANKPAKTKLWYWSAKWHELYNSCYLNVNGFAPSDRPPRIDAEFEALPVDVALKILAWLPEAVYNELAATLGSHPVVGATPSIEGVVDRTYWPDDEEIAGYLVRRGLRRRMLTALESKELVLYPQSRPETALAWMAARTGRWVFGPADDARLAKVETRLSGSLIGESVAISRSYVLPDKAPDILSAYLAANPKSYHVARELVSRFGSRGGPAVVAYFRQAEGTDRTTIARLIAKAAAKGLRVDKAFLLELVRVPTPEKDARYDNSLSELALAANAVLGRPAIGDTDIEAARYKWGKMSEEELEAANAGRDGALTKLRSLLEGQLK